MLIFSLVPYGKLPALLGGNCESGSDAGKYILLKDLCIRKHFTQHPYISRNTRRATRTHDTIDLLRLETRAHDCPPQAGLDCAHVRPDQPLKVPALERLAEANLGDIHGQIDMVGLRQPAL